MWVGHQYRRQAEERIFAESGSSGAAECQVSCSQGGAHLLVQVREGMVAGGLDGWNAGIRALFERIFEKFFHLFFHN
jgi:hypothetical protein